MSLAKLLEFRSKLKEASSLLKDAETTIAAMLIVDDYRWLGEVEAIIERALERVREARRIGRELVEEVERAYHQSPWKRIRGLAPASPTHIFTLLHPAPLGYQALWS